MRLRIVSDLHYEFHADGGREMSREIAEADGGNFDALVVAGDLGTASTVRKALHILCSAVSPKPVLFVLGNHEFYGTGLYDTGGVGHGPVHHARLENQNLHVLKEEWRIGLRIENRIFTAYGDTLWFPESEQTRSQHLRNAMADFSAIRVSDAIPIFARRQRLGIERALQRGTKPDLVVTHHLPHPKSIHPRYEYSPLNAFFLHDMSETIERNGPKLWVHGHTHTSCDYVVGNTRIVCNPLGYVGLGDGVEAEPNPDFDPGFTVELEL